MKKILLILITLSLIGCAELNPVKAPSLTITPSDTTADCGKVDITAGKYGIILYTLDGSMPTLKSNMYQGSLYVKYGTTIKTASFCPGGRRSQIVTAVINNDFLNKSIIKAEYCIDTVDTTRDIQ